MLSQRLEEEQILDFGCAESKNNRMELLACIRALQWIRQNKSWRGVTRVQIVTDSPYVYENVYRAREWKKTNGVIVTESREKTTTSGTSSSSHTAKLECRYRSFGHRGSVLQFSSGSTKWPKLLRNAAVQTWIAATNQASLRDQK